MNAHFLRWPSANRPVRSLVVLGQTHVHTHRRYYSKDDHVPSHKPEFPTGRKSKPPLKNSSSLLAFNTGRLQTKRNSQRPIVSSEAEKGRVLNDRPVRSSACTECERLGQMDNNSRSASGPSLFFASGRNSNRAQAPAKEAACKCAKCKKMRRAVVREHEKTHNRTYRLHDEGCAKNGVNKEQKVSGAPETPGTSVPVHPKTTRRRNTTLEDYCKRKQKNRLRQHRRPEQEQEHQKSPQKNQKSKSEPKNERTADKEETSQPGTRLNVTIATASTASTTSRTAGTSTTAEEPRNKTSNKSSNLVPGHGTSRESETPNKAEPNGKCESKRVAEHAPTPAEEPGEIRQGAKPVSSSSGARNEVPGCADSAFEPPQMQKHVNYNKIMPDVSVPQMTLTAPAYTRPDCTSWRLGTDTHFGGHTSMLQLRACGQLFAHVPLYLFFSATFLPLSLSDHGQNSSTKTSSNACLQKSVNVNGKNESDDNNNNNNNHCRKNIETQKRTVTGVLRYNVVLTRVRTTESLSEQEKPTANTAAHEPNSWLEFEDAQFSIPPVHRPLSLHEKPLVQLHSALQGPTVTPGASKRPSANNRPEPPKEPPSRCDFLHRHVGKCACSACARRATNLYASLVREYERDLRRYKRCLERYERANARLAASVAASQQCTQTCAQTISLLQPFRRVRYCRQVPRWRAQVHYAGADAPVHFVTTRAAETSYLARRVADTLAQTAVLRVADIGLRVFVDPRSDVVGGAWSDWVPARPDAVEAARKNLAAPDAFDWQRVSFVLELANHPPRYEICWQIQLGSAAASLEPCVNISSDSEPV